jgi:Na+-transporting NADH:ubiquinone oxidoreductase subunit NqrC
MSTNIQTAVIVICLLASIIALFMCGVTIGVKSQQAHEAKHWRQTHAQHVRDLLADLTGADIEAEMKRDGWKRP